MNPAALHAAYLLTAGLQFHAPVDITKPMDITVTSRANGEEVVYTTSLWAGQYWDVPAWTLPASVEVRFPDGRYPMLRRDYSCAADFNGDGDCATDADLEAFFAAYGLRTVEADLNGDGAVDPEDVVAFFDAMAG